MESTRRKVRSGIWPSHHRLSSVLEGRGPRSPQLLTHVPSTYQRCQRSPQSPPRGLFQCWGVCGWGSLVPRGLRWGVRRAALGSCPRAQKRKG